MPLRGRRRSTREKHEAPRVLGIAAAVAKWSRLMVRNHVRERETWHGIRQRCYNPNNTSYKNYGGRGIKVCDQWRGSFKQFYADMGDCPDGMEIDRIDNDGNYEPGNCRWVFYRDNLRNRRNNRHLIIDGRKMTVADWAIHFRCTHSVLNHAKIKHGWKDDVNYRSADLANALQKLSAPRRLVGSCWRIIDDQQRD